MASYKERLGRDLDRWIDAGLVPAGSRTPILDSVPDLRRPDAAAALVWVGAVLFGLALVAFIAANWDVIPRLVQFVLILGLFAAAAGGAAWCAGKSRPNAANVLLALAGLLFAAAIGLTGQIFDIAGDPRTALCASGVVAAALALAGRSSGAAVAALIFFCLGDFQAGAPFDWDSSPTVPWLLGAAPLAAALAMRWRSAPLAHAAAIGMAIASVWLAGKLHVKDATLLWFSLGCAALAVGGRVLRQRGLAFGAVFYGWFAWLAMAYFIVAGVDHEHGLGILHRLAWLVIAGALVAAGRHDRQGAITVLGVLALIGGISALLSDLGFGLMTAAGVFLAASLLAALAGLALRRRPA